MWGSEQDPGGSGAAEGSKELPQTQEDMKERYEQQQILLAQLKEMLRKSEHSTSVSREKVEEYASTLSEINAKAKLSKIKRTEARKHDPDDGSSKPISSSRNLNVITPAKEKINLLQQKLEENRVKLAQRDKNQKDIEEMVYQLKAQLDDTQVLITETDTKSEHYDSANFTIESTKEDLLTAIKCKDNHILELTSKMQQLQANVLDLQENIKEKDSVIDARTKAITLLSENLSKKGKNTLDMLDETKEQMRHMQENFVQLEMNMKEENAKLRKELDMKDERIKELLESNNNYETNCNDLQSANLELQSKITTLSTELDKYKLDLTESETKIQELSKINEDFELKLSQSVIETQKSEPSTPQKSGKKGKGKNKKTTPPPETPSVETNHLARIAELEKELEELKATKAEISEESNKKDDLTQLNKQLEEMNKNMIKMKAQHKAKLKELQKKSSPSELSEKVSTLESENVKLGQRVAELEDEKGNLQLRLVDLDTNKEKEYIADIENKIEEQKMEIENHIRTITSLESQLTSSSNEISSLRSELSNLMHLENAQVCSEMTSVQLEEQLDKEVSQKKEIQDKFNEIVKENETLLEKIELLNKEKLELSTKLDTYMQENIELIDRLEKLSAEKVSSAESIEIVESLTQQEKLEIEAYQKNLEYDSEKQPEDNTDLEHQESDTKSTEETSPTELMERIELFTVERREVMDKMDNLTAENQQLLNKLDRFDKLEEKYETLLHEKEKMMTRIDKLSTENNELLQKIKSFEELGNEKLQEELTEYRALLENQKIQIASLQEELWNKPDSDLELISKLTEDKNKLENLNEALNIQLSSLQKEHESLRNEYQSLKESNIEKELIDAKIRLLDLESKLTENNEEINFLQSSIEDNKTELVTAAEKIAEYDKSLAMKNAEVEILKNEIEDLQQTIVELNSDLEKQEYKKQEEITMYSSQLQEFKNMLSEHMEQLQQYENETKQNSQTIEDLNDQIEELNYKIIENQHEVESKTAQILTLNAVKSEYEHKIHNLEGELNEKNNTFAETCRQLKEKCKSLENQIQTNTGSIDDIKIPFETKIKELETKNKEQVEKMKKIAANLKKKTATCHELETKLAEIKEKWENESKEKDEKQKIINEQHSQLQDNEKKINSLLCQLQEIESELSNLQQNRDSQNSEYEQMQVNFAMQMEQITSEKTILENKLKEFDGLNFELQKLRDELFNSVVQQNCLRENIAEKDKIIDGLYTEINIIKSESAAGSKEIIHSLSVQIEEMKLKMETTQNAMDAKIQEKDMFIENLEAENNKYKERILKLEEGLSNIEERRQILEERALNLKVQLEEKAYDCEEASQSEDLLERRLSALIAHDEVIELKLKQSNEENETLQNKTKDLIEENEKLKIANNEYQNKLQENSQNNEKMEQLENECSRLTNIITNLENDLKKTQVEYERKLSEKMNEVESMETELNSQLQEFHAERKNILNRCEVLQDNIKEYVENEQLLNDEICKLQQTLSTVRQELETKLIENQQLNTVNSNNLSRIEELENHLCNLQSNSSQGNDIHSMQIELDRLQKLIAQKDIDIQNYQRQNMQLQMAASFGNTSSSNSIFDSASTESEQLKASLSESNARCATLEQQVQDITMKLNQAEMHSQQYATLEQQYRDITEQLNTSKVELQQVYEKLNEMQQIYQLTQQDLETQKSMVVNLQQELSKQTEQLVKETAEDNINKIVTTAEEIATREIFQPIEEPIIQKQEHLKLDAIPKMTEQENIEELRRKIKALEFMLFNTEKEKDDTLTQCHEFANELTRLIYEREKLLKHKREKRSTEVDFQSIENQIEPSETNLNEIEFPAVQVQINKNLPENVEPRPIDEEMIQPKATYLCFTGDEPTPKAASEQQPEEAWGWGNEDQKLRETIDSQIVSMEQMKITPEDKKILQELEFGKVEMPKAPTDPKTPVHETISDPKSAYLCYPVENVKNVDTFASEEDGWGWNAEEAKLEAEHRQSLGAVQPLQITEGRIEQLEEKIHDLEVERSRLLEEVKTNQIRSGKLIKKMKLMKENYEKSIAELNKNKPSDDFGLDMAIQDELNNQIKSLEKKLKEMTDEISKDKAEKENLLKRLDVLQSANERMVELKEKTDNEIQFLQFKNRELSSKLEQLEWGDDSPYKSKTPTNIEEPLTTESNSNLIEYEKKLDELSKEISLLKTNNHDLMLDNEELQLLLEEQRKLRIEAEKAISNNPIPENMKTEQEYLKVENEKRNLQEEITKLHETKQILEAEISNYKQKNEDFIIEKSDLELHIQNLSQKNADLNDQLEQKQYKCIELQNEFIELENKYSFLTSEYENMKKNQLDTCNLEIVQLKEEIFKQENEKQNLSIILKEKEEELKHQIEAHQLEILKLNEELTKLQNDKQLIENNLTEKEICVQQLNNKIQQLETEKSALDLRLQEILNIQTADKTNDEKLRQMNEQLMSSLSELELKNKELTELNNSLQIDKLETEQKLSVTIEQLAQEWSERVDQRGNDIAESWKLHLETVENEFSQREEKLKSELNEIFNKNEEIIVQNNELQKQVDILISEKQEFVSDNNNIIQTLQQSMNAKQTEIIELSQKLQEINSELELKNTEISTLKESSELMQIKEMELQEAVYQLESKISECNELKNQLEIKDEACKDLESKLNEMNMRLVEIENQNSDLKNIIESQVLKTEEVKQALEEKNKDYNALLEEFENFENVYLKSDTKQNILLSETDNFATEEQILQPESEQSQIEIDNANAPVNRAELDLALYMLHQRDVRCEELTVELMQLLEERDTLQLKLSNAIRLNEELRVKLDTLLPAEQETRKDSPKAVKSTGAIPKSKAIVLGATGTELATEATEKINPETKLDLDQKLSQLHSIGYRDKTLKDDQESRHIQQLSLMQQHRDLASKLPPEAAARLVDANYTLSRDVQSPSKVLLNWLWGRSTPKVNDV